MEQQREEKGDKQKRLKEGVEGLSCMHHPLRSPLPAHMGTPLTQSFACGRDRDTSWHVSRFSLCLLGLRAVYRALSGVHGCSGPGVKVELMDMLACYLFGSYLNLL